MFDASDDPHDRASLLWGRLCGAIEGGDVTAVTHSLVVFEASAVLQDRLGLRAVRDLHDLVLPVVDVRWVDEMLHARAVTSMVAADRRRISLVDWTSFLMMREAGIDCAFAFDDDFVEQGLEVYA